MRDLFGVLGLGFAAMSPTIALAQQLTQYDGPDDGSDPDTLIAASDLPNWATGGIDGVTIVRDDEAGRWRLFFGARLSAEGQRETGLDFSGCRPAPDASPEVFVIGAANSRDGLTWDVEGDYLFAPLPESWLSCGARHPRAVVVPDAQGDLSMTVFFSGVQPFDACRDGEPSWGCDRFPGVGALFFRGSELFLAGADSPLWPLAGAQNPSAIVLQAEGAPVGDATILLFASRPEGIFTAAAKDLSSFPVAARPSVRPGTWSWARSRWVRATGTCGPKGSKFPYQAWMLGASDGGGAGLDELRSDDRVTWYGDGNPSVSWPGAPQWSTFEAVRNGTDTYLYYVVPTSDGDVLRLARWGGTGPFALDESQPSDRTCLYGTRPDEPDTDVPDTDLPDTGDTDVVDTDIPAETDAESDPPDTDAPPAEGCYCASPGATGPMGAPMAVAALAAAWTLLCRRRR